MRTLNNKETRKYICRGLRKKGKVNIPSDGTMRSLYYQAGGETKPHIQVELINDCRFYAKPIVTCYYWPAPHRSMYASMAPYCLTDKDYYRWRYKIKGY